MSLTRTELKKVKSLQTRKGRDNTGLFAAEGVRLLEEARRFRRRPATIYYTPALISERGLKLVEDFKASGADVQDIPASQLSRVTGVETSQGIIGLFRIPDKSLSKLYRSTVRNILVCENLSDPGNVGALVRSALAFGFDLVTLVGNCADPYAPKTVRSTVGAIFGIPVAVADKGELLELVGQSRGSMLASTPRGSVSLRKALSAVGSRRLFLAVGAESDGLSSELMAGADHQVRISHTTRVESLNSAIAGSILLNRCYDLRIRRRR